MNSATRAVAVVALVIFFALGIWATVVMARKCGPDWWLYGNNLSAAVLLGYCDEDPRP